MRFLKRRLSDSIAALRDGYPAILVTGPRQSGKTTLAQEAFPDLPYVNFESPIERADFEQDPTGFLSRFPDGAILDEIQYVPEALSYLQVRIDAEGRTGRWALTGSQQMELSRQAAQSLTSRTTLLELLPFSRQELVGSPTCARTLAEAAVDLHILTGFQR